MNVHTHDPECHGSEAECKCITNLSHMLIAYIGVILTYVVHMYVPLNL